MHAAALLLYLAGKARERFDWAQRPFFLQFGEEAPAVRERAYAELCRRLGIEANTGTIETRSAARCRRTENTLPHSPVPTRGTGLPPKEDQWV